MRRLDDILERLDDEGFTYWQIGSIKEAYEKARKGTLRDLERYGYLLEIVKEILEERLKFLNKLVGVCERRGLKKSGSYYTRELEHVKEALEDIEEWLRTNSS